jgi:hypothetical protein
MPGKGCSLGLLAACILPQAFDFTLAAPKFDDAAILAPASLSSVIRYGVSDFQDDAQHALGRKLPAVTSIDKQRAVIIVGVAGHDDVIDRLASAGKIDVARLQGKWESYLIVPIEHPFPGVEEALVIAGSDDRGALYGLYEVSESTLGTDPLKFWTDHVPPHLATAAWERGIVFQDEPSFRFRGLYINDENFLMGWKGNPDDIEPELWAKIFETTLRLRENTCSQADYAKPMTPETVALLKDRGLYLTGSHVDLLLSNPMGAWPAYTEKIGQPGLPYSYVKNAAQMEAFWKTGVTRHLGEHVIWPIGLRWTDDRDFFENDPNAPSDWPSRGKIVNDAVAAEIKILRETLPSGEAPITVFSMRGAAHLHAFNDGELTLPEDAINLYNDKGSSARFLNPPTPESIARHKINGIYYHLTYCDNQWVQWVSPALIQEELSKAVQAGITRMAILNVGDIREIPLSLSAAAAFTYDDQPWIGEGDYASVFSRKWCTYQYGQTAGPQIAQLLDQYFKLEYDTRASTIIESFQGPLLGLLPKVFKNWKDCTLVGVARAAASNPDQLAHDLGGYDPTQEGLSSRFGHLGRGYLESVQPQWANLRKTAISLASQVPESARPFYYFSVTSQIESSQLASQFGLSMYRALAATKEKNFDVASAEFEHAARQMLEFKTIRAPSATGKWAGWYNGEEITGWDGIPWGASSSWSVHSDRAAAALREISAICNSQPAKPSQVTALKNN